MTVLTAPDRKTLSPANMFVDRISSQFSSNLIIGNPFKITSLINLALIIYFLLFSIHPLSTVYQPFITEFLSVSVKVTRTSIQINGGNISVRTPLQYLTDGGMEAEGESRLIA